MALCSWPRNICNQPPRLFFWLTVQVYPGQVGSMLHTLDLMQDNPKIQAMADL